MGRRGSGFWKTDCCRIRLGSMLWLKWYNIFLNIIMVCKTSKFDKLKCSQPEPTHKFGSMLKTLGSRSTKLVWELLLLRILPWPALTFLMVSNCRSIFGILFFSNNFLFYLFTKVTCFFKQFIYKKINAEITTALKYINHSSTSMRRMYIYLNVKIYL